MLERRWKVVALLVGLAAPVALAASDQVHFLTGGALVNLGYSLQDGIAEFDLKHGEDVSPAEVWAEVVRQNELAAGVRANFPRTAYHPLVAMVVCMDGRLDTNELVGDTRHYYYVLRTAGSVLDAKEEEMLELAVQNGVKVILLTTHTDCAAEKAARDPAARARFPELARAIDERELRIRELLERPVIKQRIADGRLLVKRMNIDTMTEHLRAPEHSALANKPLH